MRDFFALRKASLDKKIRLNTVLLFVFNVISIGISFLLVPLLIDYLDTKLYGVWLTILSITAWINFFDIGIGHGLRNKLTESLVREDIRLARSFVSTAYLLVSFISAFIFAIFLLGSNFVNWAKVFNIETSYNAQLYPVMIVVMVSILINFILSLNNSVAYANQEASFPGCRQLVFNLSLLIGVLTLLATSRQGNLFKLAAIYALATVGSNAALGVYLFNKHRFLIPFPRFFALKHAKPLMSLGVQFLVIQIACLIIFATDNLIITQILGPSEVTTYNVIHKLFSPLLFAHTIIITPLWSAFTERYTKGNFEWIKGTLRKLNIYTLLLASSIVILVLFSKYIILLWLKDLSFYKLPLVIVMGLYTLIIAWNNNYAYFLNGISNLKMQLYSCVIGASVNIPISIFLAKNIGLGSTGVALGSVISLSLFAVGGPLRTIYVLKSETQGGIFPPNNKLGV